MLLNQSLARVLCIACLILGTNFALAQNSSIAAPATAASAPKPSLPEGVTEEMLAPPPVPGFMLRAPAMPLSLDEMVQQVHEAEQKAGIRPVQNPNK